MPFWLQPLKHYQGAAWYQRDVEIPETWRGLRVTLSLERPHWETCVWLDGREIGRNQSLSTPHPYDLGGELAPGRHRLTIRVDNRMIVNVGPNAHSVSDHTQTNWNGIVGRIELAAGSPVWLEDVQVYPDVTGRTVRVKGHIGSALMVPAGGTLRLAATAYNAGPEHVPDPQTIHVAVPAQGTTFETVYPLGAGALSWDEFRPALYRLSLSLETVAGERRYRDQASVSFGLREVEVSGTQLAINGRKIFLRGTLECCVFPLTGYPPSEVAPWRRILRICRAHGLNHLRFHSWCPPEAAFVAGDELGFYYQVECAAWANQGASIGLGEPLDEWLYEEGRRIVGAYGNHPSFVMMAYGNEPAGDPPVYLGRWVSYWRARDARRLYTGGAGWPVIPENQYHNIPAPRIQAWGAGLSSRINALPPETLTDYTRHVQEAGVPIVSHEIGQWCVFPNLDEAVKYHGALRARNFEIFRDLLAAHHIADQSADFLLASGKLQALCYKEEIESALRTPGFGGFQLLGLNDFPGQGTALVGVLDPFWDSKGYITPEAFSRFCNCTVPLARMAKRVWTESETFAAGIDIAHFGPEPFDGAEADWRLVDADGNVAASGHLALGPVATGSLQHAGTVSVPLSRLTTPRRYRLAAGIVGTRYENDWDIWVYPDQVDLAVPEGVLVVERLDGDTLAHLEAGGRALLALRPEAVRADSQIGFSSVFWNTAWTGGQPPHTLGILCDPAHPALAGFPTDYHSDWQWWELIHGAAAMTLDPLPAALRPLVQPIDTWFESRRLGLLFEVRVGGQANRPGGKLLVCSMDLRSDLAQRPVARQMLSSLLHYAGSEHFRPRVGVTATEIRGLYRD